MNWKKVDKVSIQGLVETRKALHQSVQLVSAFPRNVLKPDPTDENASLVWHSKLEGLQSNPSEEGQSIHIGISFKDFNLVIFEQDTIVSRLDLNGISVHRGLTWLRSEVNKYGINGNTIDLELPYEIEAYDYSKNLFGADQALKVFSALFSNANNILDEGTEKWKESSEVRCWPHHFDIATLIPLEHNENGDLAKSIGVGLSPGDEAINEPYFYVNSWPNVSFDSLRKHKLSFGHWNKEGWSGAVLHYSDFIDGDQQQIVEEFIRRTILLLINFKH